MNNPEHEILFGNHETILLVDDNQDILETSRDILETLDFKVLTASNGREAIDVYQNQSNIDLFILDVMMPIMGGVAFAEWIIRKKPHARIIFCTGSDRSNELKLFMQQRDVCLLSKPCTIPILSQAIHKVLEN